MSGRTAIIAHSHPAFTRGGGELAAHRHFQHLQASGNDVTFAGMMIDPAQSLKYMTDSNRAMEVAPRDFVLAGAGMDSFEMEHESSDVEDWLVDFLVGLNADVYHFHHIWNIGIGTIRRLRRARPQAALSLTLHDYTPICANHGQMVRTNSGALCQAASTIDCASCFPKRAPIDLVVRRQRMREAMEVFDLLLSPSRFLAQRFEDWGVPASRITVLENGLPAATPPPPEDKQKLERRSRQFAFFGSATPTKGLDVLCHAARLLERGGHDITLSAHGVSTSDMDAHWPGLARPANLVLRGRYAPEDAIPLMRAVGWVIVPSVWWENAPVVIEEARAAQTPVIASDIGGMAEKVAGFGLTFRVGDPSELARLIAELAGDTNKLLAHRALIEQPFGIAEYAQRLEQALADALASGRGANPRAVAS